jgi:acetyltransferase-like isoleucine patch superfamily enzyme
MLDRGLRAIATLFFFIELRLRGVQWKSHALLRGMKPRIRNAGTMRVGREFRVHGRVTRVQLATSPSGVLSIGDRVGMNEGVSIYAEREVTIGDSVMIGDYVSIVDTDFHPVTPGDPVRVAPVRIERNAWVGRNAIILRGVTIGMNAVVAAGSVVTSSVPPNTLAAGNPARVIRELSIPDPESFIRGR